MRDRWLRQWFGPGLLAGLSLMQGCNYAGHQRWGDSQILPDNGEPPLASAVPAARADKESLSAAATGSGGGWIALLCKDGEGRVSELLPDRQPGTVVSAIPPHQVGVVRASVVTTEPPLAAAPALPAPPAQPLRSRTPPADPAVVQAAAFVAEAPPVQDPKDPVPEVRKGDGRKKAVSGRATQTRFGHAADYAWLMGELQYIQTRKAWHLRYAPTDEQDPYGGTVTLVGDGLTSECKSGQIVHVEGNLINPESGDLRPLYWASKLRILKSAPPVVEDR